VDSDLIPTESIIVSFVSILEAYDRICWLGGKPCECSIMLFNCATDMEGSMVNSDDRDDCGVWMYIVMVLCLYAVACV
jgi:hypothetical protein